MSGLQIDGRMDAGDLSVEVALEVAPGETVAVLGPNGAGKTTVLRAISGLLPLTSGVLRLDGTTLDEVASGTWVPVEARSIGYVFQDLLLFPNLDVIANVAFGVRARGMGRRTARAAAAAWLERVDLSARAGAAVGELSGGEAQRVALVRALASEPRALLLDEPLSALDVEIRAKVRRQLRDHLRLHAGPCVIVTHDPLDAALLADRVVVLEAGRVSASGRLADLVARPRTAWAAELAGTNLLPASAKGVRLSVAGGGELICAEAGQDGPVLVAIRPASVNLHLAVPEGSARNVWSATVAEVEGFGDRYRVRLDGAVPLVAEVTGGAVLDLGLRPGLGVWVSVKATEVSAYPA